MGCEQQQATHGACEEERTLCRMGTLQLDGSPRIVKQILFLNKNLIK